MEFSRFMIDFPEVDEAEALCLEVSDPDSRLPLGMYIFEEWYCTNPQCDCRRVILHVRSMADPERVLAGIGFGWESFEFYRRWVDAEVARESVEGSLDPMNPQSEYAGVFLSEFQARVKADPWIARNFASHYAMVKRKQGMDVPSVPQTLQAGPMTRQQRRQMERERAKFLRK